jgi:dihydroorotase
MTDFLLQGGRIFDPASGLDAVGDLLVQNEIIAAVGDDVSICPGAEIIDARGLWLLPGLMDIHVHLREPGQEHKETIATGTRAAARGGFTTVACEPNTSPACDTPEGLGRVARIAAREAFVRVLPKCTITVGRAGGELADLAALRAAGAVAGSDDGDSVGRDDVMRAAVAAAKQAGLPLTVHVDGPEMMARDIALAAELDWMVHFSHVSLAAEAELIARARLQGLRVTGEVTPHHLALTLDGTPNDDPNYKMNPPLASPADRAALRSAVASGVLTVIASDHAPHAPEEKALPYEDVPPGAIGLETTLGVVWTCFVQDEREQAEAALRALTAGPANVLSVDRPTLAEGAPADIVLFDPDQTWFVDPDEFESKARNCPFAGMKLRGRAISTIRNGRFIMRDGSILDAGVTQ